MRTIVADKVEQSQVREPVVLMIAVDMVDVDLVIHCHFQKWPAMIAEVACSKRVTLEPPSGCLPCGDSLKPRVSSSHQDLTMSASEGFFW